MGRVIHSKIVCSSTLKRHWELVPGLLLCFLIGTLSYYLGLLYPVVGGAVFGILIGILIRNTVGTSRQLTSGINFTAKKLLKLAIILLGAGLNLSQIWKTGLSSLSVLVFTLLTAYGAAYFFGKRMKVPDNLIHLIGTGTAICGASAIAAVSPIVKADDSEICYSISTVFLFNVIAVLIFPQLGYFLHMSDSAFGLWAGTAINDTSSVVAAGYIFSDPAGAYATIVKLTRTTMIIPIAMLYAAYVTYKRKNTAQASGEDFSLIKIVPWFILGFLGAALLNTIGLIDGFTAEACTWMGKFLIIAALAAVGLQADIREMVSAGVKPIFLGLIVWCSISVVSLLVQHFMLGQL
jgi:uncharacterized integral membrane protein (TIGR00698 family)